MSGSIGQTPQSRPISYVDNAATNAVSSGKTSQSDIEAAKKPISEIPIQKKAPTELITLRENVQKLNSRFPTLYNMSQKLKNASQAAIVAAVILGIFAAAATSTTGGAVVGVLAFIALASYLSSSKLESKYKETINQVTGSANSLLKDLPTNEQIDELQGKIDNPKISTKERENIQNELRQAWAKHCRSLFSEYPSNHEIRVKSEIYTAFSNAMDAFIKARKEEEAALKGSGSGLAAVAAVGFRLF